MFKANLKPRETLILLLLAAFTLLFSACFPEHRQSTFDAAGPVARMQLTLFQVVFWAAAVIFVAVEGALLYSVLRYRKKAGQGLPKQVHGNTPLEIAWTIAPALVVIFIAVPTVQTIFKTANPPTDDTLQVNVVAHQWWWEFHYPDFKYQDPQNPAKEKATVTANELHIPVGKAISITLTSKDVIHSFWVPKLGGKVDIVPNQANTLWLQADRPGTFYGQCAEFCGISHANMRFRVIAESPEEFQAWVKGQQASPVAVTAETQKGLQVFEGKQCIFCHTIQGTKGIGTAGPNLTHVGSRTSLAAGILENDAEGKNLAAWLANPQAMKPGTLMPNLGLLPEEISALVKYLQSLK